MTFDVIILRVCRATVYLHSRSFPLLADWRKSDGEPVELEFKFERRSCELSFLFPSRRHSFQESLARSLGNIIRTHGWTNCASTRAGRENRSLTSRGAMESHSSQWHWIDSCQTLLSKVLVTNPFLFVVDKGFVFGRSHCNLLKQTTEIIGSFREYETSRTYHCLISCNLLYS